MRIVTLLLAVLAMPTVAADFRTLDIGDSCAEVVSKESSLGSRAIKSRVEGMSLFTFEGLEFDRQLVFSYFCPSGKLLAGDYRQGVVGGLGQQFNPGMWHSRYVYSWICWCL